MTTTSPSPRCWHPLTLFYCLHRSLWNAPVNHRSLCSFHVWPLASSFNFCLFSPVESRGLCLSFCIVLQTPLPYRLVSEKYWSMWFMLIWHCRAPQPSDQNGRTPSLTWEQCCALSGDCGYLKGGLWKTGIQHRASGTALVKELKVSRIRIELHPRKAVKESFLSLSTGSSVIQKHQQLRPTEALLPCHCPWFWCYCGRRYSGPLITPFSLDSFLLTSRRMS